MCTVLLISSTHVNKVYEVPEFCGGTDPFFPASPSTP
uniref:Uncharacterized protein n=1 Tax=Triticum urartu TaxID=4572 RepID=A0A8R7V3P1_TRIUA